MATKQLWGYEILYPYEQKLSTKKNSCNVAKCAATHYSTHLRSLPQFLSIRCSRTIIRSFLSFSNLWQRLNWHYQYYKESYHVSKKKEITKSLRSLLTQSTSESVYIITWNSKIIYDVILGIYRDNLIHFYSIVYTNPKF